MPCAEPQRALSNSSKILALAASHHPHVHCVVPGGGLSPDHRRWIPCRPNFFLPVKVLSLVFRGKFLQALEQAFHNRKLTLAGQLSPLQSPAAFQTLLRTAASRNWVVYAKRPFAGPSQVLTYLSRYTHRIAIANSRLVSMVDGKVTFRWRDYANGCQSRTMTLEVDEFLPCSASRFCTHPLLRHARQSSPKTFVRSVPRIPAAELTPAAGNHLRCQPLPTLSSGYYAAY